MGSVLLPQQATTIPDARRLGVPITGMLSHRSLPSLLAPAALVVGQRACWRERPDALLAWGRRPSAARVQRLGQRWNVPVWHLEDGFLRSIGKGPDQPPLCLLVDDIGVHLDAGAPSRLETRIGALLSPAQTRRAVTVRALWREQRLSKLNPPQESAASGPFVLVVDQSAGDRSIDLGQASAASFTTMLAAAVEENGLHRGCESASRRDPWQSARAFQPSRSEPSPRAALRGWRTSCGSSEWQRCLRRHLPDGV